MKKQVIDILDEETKSLVLKLNGDSSLISDLRKKEFSIFDKVEIKKLTNGLKYLVLKIANITLIPVKHVSRVVNAIHLIYGIDDHGKGRFSVDDIIALSNGDVDWKGRSWMQSEKYLQPAMIQCDDLDGLKLMVMNV